MVPYNPYLTCKYNSHINVEICATVLSVKYMYKYIYKGHDQASVRLKDNNNNNNNNKEVDEISEYVERRYVSAIEACWRLLNFNIQK